MFTPVAYLVEYLISEVAIDAFYEGKRGPKTFIFVFTKGLKYLYCIKPVIIFSCIYEGYKSFSQF